MARQVEEEESSIEAKERDQDEGQTSEEQRKKPDKKRIPQQKQMSLDKFTRLTENPNSCTKSNTPTARNWQLRSHTHPSIGETKKNRK